MYKPEPFDEKNFFAWVAWGESDIETKTTEVISFSKRLQEDIKNTPEADRNFSSVTYKLDQLYGQVLDLGYKLEFLMNVSPSAQIRKAAENAKEKVNLFLNDLAFDAGIYQAVKSASEKQEQLEADAKKLQDELLRHFRKRGLDLKPEDQAELKKISARLQELGTKFQLNINNYKDSIVLEGDEVSGLSKDYLSRLNRTEDGKYEVTLAYPDYKPFVELAENAQKRKELIDKYNRKGGEENIALLKEAVELRGRVARLLGYESWVAYNAEEKTAKTQKNISDFLYDTSSKLKEIWKKELKGLEDFKSKLEGGETGGVKYFETAFLENKQRKEIFGLDFEKVKEYFPLEFVLEAMLEFYQELFGIKFEKVNGVELWHEDVFLYRVQSQEGELISFFALDLHPREGKYDHAAEFPLVDGRLTQLTGGGYVIPFASMVTNFPKASLDFPSLMPHEEVGTLFHEFGHVVHQNLGRTRFFSHAGTSVAGDFVEAPSQMLEYWVWQPEILRRITRHYESGEVMPEDMIAKLLESKNFGMGYFNVRQFVLAIFDFELHTGKSDNPVELYESVYKKFLELDPPDGQLFPACFGHLMNGYEGNYYGYMWSKVFAADMFSVFKEKGILNSEIGKSYADKILRVGSSREEMQSLEDFLGRAPSNKAFLEELGVG